MGELVLSPIGLSMVNKLAPLRFASLLMGVWYLSMGTANKFASGLASLILLCLGVGVGHNKKGAEQYTQSGCYLPARSESGLSPSRILWCNRLCQCLEPGTYQRWIITPLQLTGFGCLCIGKFTLFVSKCELEERGVA